MFIDLRKRAVSLCCTLVLLQTGLQPLPGLTNEVAVVVLTWNVVDAVRLVLFSQRVLWSDQLSSDCLSSTVRDHYPARKLANKYNFLGERLVFNSIIRGTDIQEYRFDPSVPTLVLTTSCMENGLMCVEELPPGNVY